jgi:hypothetical protein
MNLDIISGDSYGRFNIKFASIAGLPTAVYMSELLDILKQVNHKRTFDENGFFTINREYVESRTTLTVDEQYKCDQKLAGYGIIASDEANPDHIAVCSSAFLSLILEDDQDILAEARKKLQGAKSKRSAAEGKRIGIVRRLQSGVTETDPELLAAYHAWIEVVYDRGVCRAPQVEVFRNTINKYTTDKSYRLKIIEIATANAYKEAAWAIQIFEKQYKSTMSQAAQPVSTGALGKSF